MRRMVFSITAVCVAMVLLVSLIMAFVPEGDTITSRRYNSGKGFGFDYPRDWVKASSAGVDYRAYSGLGYAVDSVFTHGLLGSASLTVLISEAYSTREEIEPMTEELIERYKSYGYDMRKMGYASYGGRVYNEIAYTVNGVSVSEYLLAYSGHTFVFVFASADESDISDMLSSVFFSFDTESEAA